MIDEPWCTKNTPSQTNMLFLSGIIYIPSGQCPGYLNEAYSWDIDARVINVAVSPAPVPAAVAVIVDRVVPGVEGNGALPGWDCVGVCAVNVSRLDDRGGVDGGSLWVEYPYIVGVAEEDQKG